MHDFTTIQLDKSLVRSLKGVREYPRQTYNEIIARMLETYKKSQRCNQYDEFLHKIQQDMMRKLWDNSEDDFWDKV